MLRNGGRLPVLACVVLLSIAAHPVGAQTFHDFYGRSDQFGGLTSVSPTNPPGYIASGYFTGGYTQGVLLALQPTGKLAWVRSYGDPLLSSVRQTTSGTFVWVGVGSVPAPPRLVPMVAGVDAVGAVQWSRAIHLSLPDGTPGDQVYGRLLEIDPKDGGYWIGGELWRRAWVNAEPWLGKLDRDGNLLWVKVLDFPESTYFNSLFPTRDGGVIGVGLLWLPTASGSLQSWMLAAKLGAGGNLVWAFRYQVINANLSRSWQQLADVDDPLGVRAGVVGTVTDFCPNVPSVPCTKPLQSVAFVADLDEATGALTESYGLWAPSRLATRGKSLVVDLSSELFAIGGEVQDNDPATQDGLLARVQFGGSRILGAMTYGDGAGPFSVELASLARANNAPPGYVFLVNEIDWATGNHLRGLVRTDLTGKSGSCECGIEVKTFQAFLNTVQLTPPLRDGRAETISIQDQPFDLAEEACSSQPCRITASPGPARKTRVRARLPEAASFTETILAGGPGAPEGRSGSAPLRVPPLKSGARLEGLAGRRGERLTFRIDVPAGTRALVVETAGGKGNVDLLLRHGKPAEGAKAGRASRGPGTREALRLRAPAAGAWYATLEGVEAFAGVTLSVRFDGQ